MRDSAYYRLDWSRPIEPQHPGERSYHALDDERHILVRVSDRQLRAVDEMARQLRADDPDLSAQIVLEEVITRAAAARLTRSAELRLVDEDFSPDA